jgi:hypothetical protein
MESKYFFSSVLAAHSSSSLEGFRQKEVRFYMELFSNWVFVKINSEPFPLHNTQIMRSLENMVRLGLVKKQGRKNPPRYKLTRAGLIKTLHDLVALPLADSYSEFFFVYQFIVNYKSRIIDLLNQDSRQFSRSNALEVEFMMDEKKYLHRQLELVDHEIRHLKERILDSEKTISLFTQLKADKVDMAKIFKTIETKYPYELNNQKRLSQLLNEMPASQREREITVANQNRVNLFWKPKLKHLESFGHILRDLEALKTTDKKAKKIDF